MFPKKNKIIAYGCVYESVLNDVEKNQLMTMISKIIGEVTNVATLDDVNDPYIIKKKKMAKQHLRETFFTFTREFPELDLSKIKPQIEQLIS